MPSFRIAVCDKPRSRQHDRAVVVAVAVVRVVQVATHEVIDVVSVRHGFVPTVGAVDMGGIVPGARMATGACLRVCRIHRQGVFFDRGSGGVMKVAIVQIIDVAFVLNGGVPAVRTVLGVCLASA